MPSKSFFKSLSTSLMVSFMLMTMLPARAATIINNNSTDVTNDIEVNTYTGGSDGRSQGNSNSTVKIKTYINGELVEDIDKTEQGQNGNSKIEIQSNTKANNNKATTSTKININGKTSESKKEVDLKNKTGSEAKSDTESQKSGTSSKDKSEVKKNSDPKQNSGTTAAGTSTEAGTTTSAVADAIRTIWREIVRGLRNLFNFI